MKVNKVLVLGGTGRTGGLVIREALAAGLGVVALVRRPEAIAESHPALTLVRGSPLKAGDLIKALVGCDGVISALNNNRASDMPWARPVSPPGFMTDSIRNVLKVMETFQARRIVVMSAAGAGKSLADVPALMRWLIRRTNLGHTYRDHDGQEAALEASKLDWTIVRPVGLSNSERRKALVVSFGKEPKPGMSISRQAVARFMVSCVNDRSYVHKAPIISEK